MVVKNWTNVRGSRGSIIAAWVKFRGQKASYWRGRNNITEPKLTKENIWFIHTWWKECATNCNGSFRDFGDIHDCFLQGFTEKINTIIFPANWRLKNGCRNSILMTCHCPDLGNASDWLKQICLAALQNRRQNPLKCKIGIRSAMKGIQRRAWRQCSHINTSFQVSATIVP